MKAGVPATSSGVRMSNIVAVTNRQYIPLDGKVYQGMRYDKLRGISVPDVDFRMMGDEEGPIWLF
jgi:hypothetical protein